MATFSAGTFLVAALAAPPACTTAGTSGPAGQYVVVGGNAQFYKYGPAQSFGPDFVLAKGRKVTMVERAFGYSRVTTDEGVTGYVATDDVAPAPPEPAPAVTPAPERVSPVRKRSNVRGTPSEPLFDVNDVPMPLPGDPVRKPGPGFRY